MQLVEQIGGQRQGRGALKQAAVEAQEALKVELCALVHRSPEVNHLMGEPLGLWHPPLLERAGEDLLAEQLHVFGEHREQAAHQEAGDGLGLVLIGLQLTRQGGEARGHLPGHPGRPQRRVEAHRVQEHQAQALTHVVLGEIIEADHLPGAIAAVAAGEAEVAPDLKAVAHVADHQERHLLPRQRLRVARALAEGLDHQPPPAVGAPGDAAGALVAVLLGLDDEGALAEEVDELLRR